MKLLISTPNYILNYDVELNSLDVLESSKGEYYGITWNSTGDTIAISCSGIKNSSLVTLEHYVSSEKGSIVVGGRNSWPFLSGPHQIQWVDERYILATNTGRNALTRFAIDDQGVRHFRYDDILWDRLTPMGREGSHFNSIFYKHDKVYLAAHNFDKGSYILELSWPSLEQISDPKKLEISGIHNLWITNEGQWIVCDSNAGALVDANNGEIIWANNLQGFTRGLAASDSYLFVGNSELTSKRDVRTESQSGIWILDRNTWNVCDYIQLGEFGCVNEVRIYDQPDDCHQSNALKTEALSVFKGISTSYPDKKYIKSVVNEADRQQIIYTASQPNIHNNSEWKIKHANAAIVFDQSGLISMPRDGFAIIASKNFVPSINFQFNADLHFLGASSTDHASLIGRYRGPGDQNMCAALFQLDDSKLTASIWENNGTWRRINQSQFEIISKDDSVAGNNSQDSRNCEISPVSIEFRVQEADAEIIIGNLGSLKALLTSPSTTGELGIRFSGRSLGFSSIKYKVLEAISPDNHHASGPMVFVHIPKCSGTSFENYLKNSEPLRDHSSCYTGGLQKEAKLFDNFVNNNRHSKFLYGHVKYEFFERFFPNGLLVTFLRDPIKRTISHYKHWHDSANFPLQDPGLLSIKPEVREAFEFAQSASLRDFVNTNNTYIKGGALGNMETLLLSSVHSGSLADHLESAKENLAKCIFFGLTEKFEESIDLFRSIFLDAPEYALEQSLENRSRELMEEIPIDVINTIRQQVSYDIELYEYAKKLFEERKISVSSARFFLSQLNSLNDEEHRSEELRNKGKPETNNLLIEKEEENILLRQIIAEVSALYGEVVDSNGWKIVELLRRLRK